MNTAIFKTVAKTVEEPSLPTWLVTVIGAEGSTPGKIGMKMLVDINGNINGTIGGGSIELMVINRIKAEKPYQTMRWQFDLGDSQNKQKQNSKKTGMICGGFQEVLVDPLFSANNLYIIGGGHCCKALSELAAKCDFNITVVDDRAEFTISTQHPFATHVICTPYGEIEKHLFYPADAFIVVMTHAHKNDELVVRKILGTQYKYLGVIGSKTKTQAVFKHLINDGFKKEELKRVFAPIGLNIGSQTPYEIAVSVLAQLIAVKNEIAEINYNSNPFLHE